jgi:hypothetical protein
VHRPAEFAPEDVMERRVPFCELLTASWSFCFMPLLTVVSWTEDCEVKG